MQQWEYIFLENRQVRDLHPERETLVYGKHEKRYSQDRPAFLRFCNQLGSEGWELVGEIAGLATFKRPIE